MTPNGSPTGVGAAAGAAAGAGAGAAAVGVAALGCSFKMGGVTFLETDRFRFLIMDAPTDSNLPLYIDVMVRKKVKYVVRACEPSYSTLPLSKHGIKVIEMPFPDGDPPPEDVITKWLQLVASEFGEKKKSEADEKSAIAVHCVAGLGRAPVLVAIALMEGGMDAYDTITFIRRKRRGALNARQITFLENYKPKGSTKKCIIS